MVNIKMLWFFLSSFCGFLFYHYHTKATFMNLFSFSLEKDLSFSFKSFIRVDLFAL